MAVKTDLVIVESPSKAKTIGKYLGPGYEVKASMGHVRDLPKSKLGVDVEHGFEPNYQPIKGKEDTISDLKKAAKKSGKVYLATDPDREGEAISWHLKELLDIPDDKTYRVTFNEITKKVVNDSIAHPRAIDMDLVNAQQARRVLDRIVGYQISPLLWKKIRRGLSAGRVQSVATRMVDDRDREIAAICRLTPGEVALEMNRARANIVPFPVETAAAAALVVALRDGAGIGEASVVEDVVGASLEALALEAAERGVEDFVLPVVEGIVVGRGVEEFASKAVAVAAQAVVHLLFAFPPEQWVYAGG